MTPVVPFEDAIPYRIIWVSPDGDDNNSGAHDAPLQSIQLAIDRATPGTAILLKPGEYTGNFEFKNIQGTEDSPIWLAAAEGRGSVTITAASSSAPVISFFGEDNLVIQDLALVGGSNGIQASQSGSDFTDLVHNVVIRGNTITDSAKDGIKVSQGVNIHVIENTVSRVGEEGVDFVGVRQSQISGNEISEANGTSAALFAKGGSSDILISNNYVHDIAADGILVGGWTNPNSFLPGTDYEAKNVEVVDNVVEETGRRPVAVLGGQDVDIHDNLFGSTEENDYLVYIGAGSPQLSPPPPSANVTVHDNVFDRSTGFARIEPESTDVVFFENVQDGVVEGDMRSSPPDPSPDPLVEVWPQSLLEAPVLWQTSARSYTTINGTSGADTLNGTIGHDFIAGGGNVDTMTGRTGDDVYDVSTWKDVIIENPGEGVDTARAYGGYTLAANVENLVVKTSAGGTFAGNELNNIMTAGAGNDVFSGRGGDDLFVLSPNASQDRITDFVAGPASRDTIDLRGFAEFSNLADVLAGAAQNGADTKISFASGGSVTLDNVLVTDLTEDDFLFRASQPEPNSPPTDIVLSESDVVEGAGLGTIVGALTAVDPDAGDALTYALVDDAGGRFAVDGTNLVVAGTLDHETADSHQVTVRATDAAGLSLDKTFAIAVGNAPPAMPIDAAPEANEVAEGAAAGSFVGIVASANDPAGGAVAYALLDDAGGRFAIDPATGTVTLADGALIDHESATEHAIVVAASDASGATTTASFTISVGNAAPAAPADADAEPNAVGEGAADGSSVGIVALSSDVNGGAVLYGLLDDAGGRFAIDPVTGAVTVANGSLLDHDTAAEHQITVQASDSSGATSTAAFTIAVDNRPPSPPIDLSAQVDSVAEGAASGTAVGIVASASDPAGGAVTYALLDDAGGRFAIDTMTGMVTVADGALLDHESATEHAITVQASDSSGATSSESFIIAVGNAGPSTPIDASAEPDFVAEGAADGTEVGIVASASDPGGGAVTYTLLDDAGGRFAIDPSSGVVSVANGGLIDYESATEHSIAVRASDPSGAASVAVMTIAVADAAPSAPFDGAAEANAVAEGAAAGTPVGIIALSSDPGGGEVVYSLLDDAGGRFAIDPSSGVVSVADGNLIDYESAQSHPITVAATAGGLSATADFAIEVTDVAPATINGTAGADIVDATRTPPGQPLPTNEADTIYGLDGNDLLNGLGGNDFIDGGGGIDVMYGGGGDDTFVVGSTGDIVVEEADGGTDTVLSSTWYTLADNVENLTLTGAASASGTGNALDNMIVGNSGNNLLAGMAGADRLDGGPSGTDTADYSASDAGVCVSLTKGRGYGGHAEGDTLIGIDNITGSDFSDVLEGNGGTNILRGGEGIDTATYHNAKRAVTVSLATTEQQNTGGAGADRLYGIENLTGSDFDDVLTGSSVANVLRGLAGDDRIDGGAGCDTLDGGMGADVLTGGTGADCFVFGDPTGGVDTITDFVSQSDSLKIVAAAFGGTLVAGAAAPLVIAGDAAGATGAEGESYFIFDGAGVVHWDATGGSGEDAIAFARILGGSAPLSSDFLIV